MRRLSTLLLLIAALAAVAAGCGDDDNGDNGSTAAAPAAEATTSTADEDSGGESTEVRLENTAFSPKAIQAKVGEEIEWENYDSIAHNVVATSGAKFKSPTLNKDDKFEFAPTKAGTISYVCTFHPGMEGTIKVT
jgi:plastocyanin